MPCSQCNDRCQRRDSSKTRVTKKSKRGRLSRKSMHWAHMHIGNLPNIPITDVTVEARSCKHPLQSAQSDAPVKRHCTYPLHSPHLLSKSATHAGCRRDSMLGTSPHPHSDGFLNIPAVDIAIQALHILEYALHVRHPAHLPC